MDQQLQLCHHLLVIMEHGFLSGIIYSVYEKHNLLRKNKTKQFNHIYRLLRNETAC